MNKLDAILNLFLAKCCSIGGRCTPATIAKVEYELENVSITIQLTDHGQYNTITYNLSFADILACDVCTDILGDDYLVITAYREFGRGEKKESISITFHESHVVSLSFLDDTK